MRRDCRGFGVGGVGVGSSGVGCASGGVSMTAAVLREAAALMRSRADAVSYPSPWQIGGGTCGVRCNDGRNYVASTYGGVGTEEAAAEHIASWHPVVALAVADWLEATADRIDAGRDPKNGGRRNHGWRGSREALAVARAYLGGSS